MFFQYATGAQRSMGCRVRGKLRGAGGPGLAGKLNDRVAVRGSDQEGEQHGILKFSPRSLGASAHAVEEGRSRRLAYYPATEVTAIAVTLLLLVFLQVIVLEMLGNGL